MEQGKRSNSKLQKTKVSSFSLQVTSSFDEMMLQLTKKVVKSEVKVVIIPNEHVLKWKDVVNPPQEKHWFKVLHR